jgi:3',5'-cyclic AMP phosphodiesterase CpdA
LIDSLVWLHMSDFHFVARGDEFSQRVAVEALLDDVPTRIAEGESVAFVLVTGDVAFSGRPEEYDRASEFLAQLASLVDVAPERFYFVPVTSLPPTRRGTPGLKSSESEFGAAPAG